ncbi:hypothetical protein RchiOBHm_Chr4g0426281 [Rosa chinensis]|uniref:Uncharacterized protein n=1 Tax=Rosa chinensis TaxID=74649 RepID=A0A2P6QZB5_ROSCH|nr:hypothetical protein RchiOBHm_Chr4g0426281 [Rosa chinensis]
MVSSTSGPLRRRFCVLRRSGSFESALWIWRDLVAATRISGSCFGSSSGLVSFLSFSFLSSNFLSLPIRKLESILIGASLSILITIRILSDLSHSPQLYPPDVDHGGILYTATSRTTSSLRILVVAAAAIHLLRHYKLDLPSDLLSSKPSD